MISIRKKSILTANGLMSIEGMAEELKKDLEEIVNLTKSFFEFDDYINIYFDNNVINIQWKGKYNEENIVNIEKNYKDKIDSFVKKIYAE